MPDAAYIARWGAGPHEAADALIVREPGWVLLIRRRADGLWAMPGGFLNPGETALDAARREALEETSIDLTGIEPTRILRADSPDRDPRAHICTTVHLFVLPRTWWGVAVAGDDAAEVRWVKPATLVHPPYEGRVWADHARLIAELTETET